MFIYVCIHMAAPVEGAAICTPQPFLAAPFGYKKADFSYVFGVSGPTSAPRSLSGTLKRAKPPVTWLRRSAHARWCGTLNEPFPGPHHLWADQCNQVTSPVLGGGVRIHPENARMSGRHGVQYVAQCVACAALTPVVWQ